MFLNIFTKVITMTSFLSLQISISSLLILGQVLAQMCSPLLLEFTVEVCYPISEVLSGGASFLG